MPKSKPKTGPKLPAADVGRLIGAVEERAEFNAIRPWIWTQDLLNAATRLPAQPTAELACVFWLRLFGVLTELTRHYREADKLFGPIPAHDRVLAALAELLALFDEDERIYIHYRRDTEGHIWQDSYQLSGHVDKPKLVEDRFYFLLGRNVSHDDAHKSTQTVLRRYPVNELAIAVDFARRARPRILALVEALRPLHTPY